MLESSESDKVRLISHEIIFPRIPPYMSTIPQRYKQTDRQTDGRRELAMAIPRSA